MAIPKLRLITTSKKISTATYQTLSTGVHVPDGRYISAGARIVTQSTATSLLSVAQKRRYRSRRQPLFVNNTHLKLVTIQQPAEPRFVAA
ncbi:MAG: hypothetical protein AAGF83_15500 [Cyanobacteria bacterium P01_G01_bin.67]